MMAPKVLFIPRGLQYVGPYWLVAGHPRTHRDLTSPDRLSSAADVTRWSTLRPGLLPTADANRPVPWYLGIEEE